MNTRFTTIMAGAVLAIVGCQAPQQTSETSKSELAKEGASQTQVLQETAGTTERGWNQDLVDHIAADISITFESIKSNGNTVDGHTPDCKNLEAEWASCSVYKMTIKNEGTKTIKPWNQAWRIYYSNIRRVLDVDSTDFDIVHENGDLAYITPKSSFQGLAPGESKEFFVVEEYWKLFKGDYLSGAYVETSGHTSGAEAKELAHGITFKPVLENDPGNYKRVPNDNNIVQTASTRYASYAEEASGLSAVTDAEVAAMILPTPNSTVVAQGTASLANGVNISLPSGFPQASADVINTRLALLGVNSSASGYSVSTEVNPAYVSGLDNNNPDYSVSGAYELIVTSSGATIRGYDEAGVFYGLQSIASLVSGDFASDQTIPNVTVQDAPRMEYRGLEIDIARHFVSMDEMEKIINTLGTYKGNKLHVHLSDDEGWRVEIDGLPELTDVGGQRCAENNDETTCLQPALGSGVGTDNMGSGFYSMEEYIELVRLAEANFIELIPEVDAPAHARAAVVAMEARFLKYRDDASTWEKAIQYRLADPNDLSRYMGIQLFQDSYINPCMDSSYTFMDKVIGEFANMHNAAGQPLKTFHAGGDEAKNIFLGGGFEDIGGTTPWRGTVDQSLWDQPWSDSSYCQALGTDGVAPEVDDLVAHFVKNVSVVAASHGVEDIGIWGDGAAGLHSTEGLATNLFVNNWETVYWDGNLAVERNLNKGFGVLTDNPDYTYFDFPYEVDPEENGYYWATRATNTKKVFAFAPENLPQNAETSVDRDGNFFSKDSDPDVTVNGGTHGMQGHLWSETMPTDAVRDYMAFPRMLGLLERAWHRADWELDYTQGRTFVGAPGADQTNFVDKTALKDQWYDFANLLGRKELAKLDKAGVLYRIPLAGGQMVNGVLEAMPAFPGLGVQYQDANGNWVDYNAAQKPSFAAAVRSISPDGSRFSRAAAIQ